MFGFFKRTKVEKWELELLRSVITSLPVEYSTYIDQINDGLIRGVLINASDIPGYVAFTFNPSIKKKYERKHEVGYKVTNIKVYSRNLSEFVNLEIYFSTGTINGYAIEKVRGDQIDFSKIDTTKHKKEYLVTEDFDRIAHVLTQEERMAISASDIYSVRIEGKEYFHLMDLEDGDFIGIDIGKNVYRITHDPVNVTWLDDTILNSLKK